MSSTSGDPSISRLRLFSGSWMSIFGGAAFILHARFPLSYSWILLAVTACWFACGLLQPSMVKSAYMNVERLLSPIGWFVSSMLFAAVYFIVITSCSLILRLLGHDALRIRQDGKLQSAWFRREIDRDPNRYFRQY